MVKLFGLISPVIVPLVVSGLLFFSSEKKNKPKLFLSAYMLVISFVFIANAFYFEHNYTIYSYLHSLHIGTVLAIYPGAYIYIMLLTAPTTPHKKLIIHFIPSIFFFVSSALIFFPFLSPDERNYFLSEYRFNPDFSKLWLKILYFVRMANIAALFLQVFIYLILIFRQIKTHRRRIRNFFSNPDRFQLNWINIFNMSLALSAFVAVFLYTVNPQKIFGDDRYLAYPMLLIAVILWIFGIMGNNQPLLPEITDKEDEDKNDSNSMPVKQLAERLTEYFEKKKPYHNPELKIWDVARELGTNRTYISKTINDYFGKNFSAFVNSYRVSEAKRIIESDPVLPLKIVSEEVGFGSISSLSRSFSDHYNKNITRFRAGLIKS